MPATASGFSTPCLQLRGVWPAQLLVRSLQDLRGFGGCILSQGLSRRRSACRTGALRPCTATNLRHRSNRAVVYRSATASECPLACVGLLVGLGQVIQGNFEGLRAASWEGLGSAGQTRLTLEISGSRVNHTAKAGGVCRKYKHSGRF
ncbi:MAG: hypothetical protein ACI9IV_002086 [Paracoccaceae bacterium]|jgi:hypothetical protein